MVTFKDLITGDISDSPSDRLAAPIAFLVGFPIIVPCAVVYYSAKGIKKVGEKIKDKIDAKNYETETYEPVEYINTDSSTSFTNTPVDTSGHKRSKTLKLKR